MERMPITTSNNHCLLSIQQCVQNFQYLMVAWHTVPIYLSFRMVRSNGHFEWSTGNNLSTYRPMASRWQGLHLASTQDSKLSHEIEVSGQPVHWDSTQSMKVHSIQKEATRRVNVLSNAKNIIGIAKLLYRKNQITQKMTNNRLIKQTAGKPCRNSKCYILL